MPDVDLTDIDAALARAAPDLDPAGRAVAVATYRLLADDGPATTGRIAATAGVDVTNVERLLDDWSAVFRDDRGHVVGFWGLAVDEMPHRLRIADRRRSAWCAWDPLFLARVVGPLSVSTDDPISGETISYRLDEQGTVHDLSHPSSVLSFLRPDREWDDDVMATFCHHVLPFTGTDTAERWVGEHPGTFVLDLDSAIRLAARHTDRSFGSALA